VRHGEAVLVFAQVMYLAAMHRSVALPPPAQRTPPGPDGPSPTWPARLICGHPAMHGFLQ
jgi:hypothetical protein